MVKNKYIHIYQKYFKRNIIGYERYMKDMNKPKYSHVLLNGMLKVYEVVFKVWVLKVSSWFTKSIFKVK